MGDQSHRKLPPDRSSDPHACGNKKQKKNELLSHDDTIMLDEEAPENISEEVSVMDHDSKDTGKRSHVSYKDSLMGFNGVDNNGSCMEDDELLSDILNREWELPELTEEVKALMETHPVVPVSADEYNDWCRPWNGALIITVLGRKYNVYTLKMHLKRIWRTSDFDLIDLPNNYFLVRLLQKDGWAHLYQKILYEGPWVVQLHTLLVQRWTLNFDPFNNQLGRIVTWVRIPNIPMQCYNRTFISRLGNRIGKTMKVDMLTPSETASGSAKVERGKYARICVEIDLRKKLVSRVIAANMAYYVEYEGLNLICFGCGRYGHRKEQCQWTYTNNAQEGQSQDHGSSTSKGQGGKTQEIVKLQQRPNPPPEMAMYQQRPNPPPEDMFGPWMLVGHGHRNRLGRRPASSASGGERSTGLRNGRIQEKMPAASRFSVLAQMEEDDALGMVEGRRKVWVPVTSRSEPCENADALKAKSGGGACTDSKMEAAGILEIKGSLNCGTEEHLTKVGQGHVEASGRKTQEGVGHARKKGGELTKKGDSNGNNGKGPMMPCGPTVALEKERMDIMQQNPKSNTRKEGAVSSVISRRNHSVVSGSIHQLETKNILNSSSAEGLKINGMLLLEGPERVGELHSVAYLKEKFE